MNINIDFSMVCVNVLYLIVSVCHHLFELTFLVFQFFLFIKFLLMSKKV